MVLFLRVAAFFLLLASFVFSQPFEILLLSPERNAVSEDSTPMFSWLVPGPTNTEVMCNLYIDEKVAIQSMPVEAGVPAYATSYPLSVGKHSWAVRCWTPTKLSQSSEVIPFSIAKPSPKAMAPRDYEKQPLVAASMSQKEANSELFFLTMVGLPLLLFILMIWGMKRQ
ncbi:MAG: hypothetical protein N3G22_04990 [Candidatus Micrarchaeota archaeon]|nr:hypothetical protein [Candidatus Micrarchaeota archaeon]